MGFLGFGDRGGPCGGESLHALKGEDRGVHLGVIEEAHELLSRARRYRESGQISRAQQKVRAAMQVVRRGLRKHPGSAFLGRFLCGIYYELRDFNAAESCLEHLIDELLLDPDVDLTEPYVRLGIIKWYHCKDVSAAIQCFNLALAAVRPDTDPNLASEPHIHLARIYLEINAPERAREHAAQRLQQVRGCKQATILYELVSGQTLLETPVQATG